MDASQKPVAPESSSASPDMHVPYEVVRSLKKKIKHARVDLVWFQGGLAVCKSYKPRYRQKLESEVKGLKLLSDFNVAPKILEHGDLYVVMEHLDGYRNISKNTMGMISLNLAKKAFHALYKIHKMGYSTLDFHMSNVMTNGKDVKVIDFEWLYEYDKYRPSFYESPAVLGHEYFSPSGKASVHEPERVASYGSRWYPNYNKSWRDPIGVDLPDLMEAPEAILRMKRAKHILRNKVPRLLDRIKRIMPAA